MAPSSPPSYRAAAHVRTRAFGDELVLLDLAGNTQYSLNELGARVWAAAAAGDDRDAIVRAVVLEYRVDEARAREDVERIVGELVASKLLVPR